MLGKHFRVTKADDPSFSRHYTISNVMTPHIMDAYKDALVNSMPLADIATDETAQEDRTFTIKNYNQGMSATFFAENEQIYSVKGPMGKGIILEPEGLHVAFAAGTGILTFMDTVAMAARIALSQALGNSVPVRNGKSGSVHVSVNEDV